MHPWRVSIRRGLRLHSYGGGLLEPVPVPPPWGAYTSRSINPVRGALLRCFASFRFVPWLRFASVLFSTRAPVAPRGAAFAAFCCARSRGCCCVCAALRVRCGLLIARPAKDITRPRSRLLLLLRCVCFASMRHGCGVYFFLHYYVFSYFVTTSRGFYIKLGGFRVRSPSPRPVLLTASRSSASCRFCVCCAPVKP